VAFKGVGVFMQVMREVFGVLVRDFFAVLLAALKSES